MKRYLFWLLGCLATFTLQAAAPQVIGLQVEYCKNPLGVDTERPLLSWQLVSPERGQQQSGYEICFATDSLGPYRGEGKVRSPQSIAIRYAGKPLKPFTRYWWKVRVWNASGEVSPWSEAAWWETGPLSNADWKGEWIGDGQLPPEQEDDFYKDIPAPLFRRDFRTKEPVREARLYIVGLGYYEASLNGQRVGDRFLDPGWTNYGKEVLYSTYDVTGMLQQGTNTLGVTLGNGFYNPLPMRIFKPLREFLTIGQPCLLAMLRITYTNGKIETICTDDAWQTAPGPILRNNVYIGEHYDARRELPGWDSPGYDASDWKPAVAAISPPAGRLTAQMQPPIRATKILTPTRMTEVRPGAFIFDLGQNFAGVIRLKVSGPAGTHITVRTGEDVYSDGSLNVMTSVAGQLKTVWGADRGAPGRPQTAWQEDSYTLRGEGVEVWSPRFTFHGGRYIEVAGWPGRPTLDNIEGIRMNADLERTGHFECSNEMLNRLDRVLDNTFLSNVFSVQSDCPAREKFGYGGDIVGTARTFCWNYNMENFYRKVVRDFAHDQRPSGGMPETAPFNGIGDVGLGEISGPIGWQLAFGFVQRELYEYYGDLSTIESMYPTFVRQVDFLRSKAVDHIIDYCINDHESLEERIPGLFATAHYYHHVILLAEFAALTNRPKEAAQYEVLAGEIKQAFISKYVDPSTGRVGNATQGAQAFGLYYDLLPEGAQSLALERLFEAVEAWNGHVACGIFGVPALFEVLSRAGRNDIAYEMATKKTFPSWGHMLASGATTLWETWAYSDHVYSHNHPMFGSIGEWFYQALGGIRAAAPGFSRINIRPQPAGDLTWVNCTYESVRGPVTSNWKRDDERFELEVHIPTGAAARVCVPASEGAILTEGGRPISEAEGVLFIAHEGGYASFDVVSGSYRFEAKSEL